MKLSQVKGWDIMQSEMVSVLMASYNNIDYFSKAIESILNQSYTNFELIILDDCSEEDLYSVIRLYNDKRIKYVRFNKNRGSAACLNDGIHLAVGDYIAIMDADDISLKNRLEKQVDFLNKNSDIDICGTTYYRMDSNGNNTSLHQSKLSDDQIKSALFLGETSVHHPTSIIRKEVFEKGIIEYEPEFVFAEDYRLWCRCSIDHAFANIPVPLFRYRVHNKSVSLKYSNTQRRTARRILALHLKNLGVSYTPDELLCHFQYCLPMNETIDRNFMNRIERWHYKLQKTISERRLFNLDVYTELSEGQLEKIKKRYNTRF